MAFKFGAKSEKQEKFFSDQFDKVKNDIEALIQSDNLAAWEKQWVSTDVHPLNFVTAKAYSGLYNHMILAFAQMAGGYTSSQWAGIGQIKDVGARVKKEELKNGHPIFVPKFMKKEETDSNGKVREKVILIGFNVFCVYNLDQCEEVNPELDRREQIETGWSGDVMEAEEIIAQTHAEIKHGYDRAAYSLTKDIIMLPNKEAFKTTEAYYATAFHELTHWSGAADRLNRFNERNHDGFGSENYSKEELVAEFGAAMLKVRCGIDDGHANAAAYIKHWWGQIQNDVSELPAAFVKAGKAVEYLCDENNFLI